MSEHELTMAYLARQMLLRRVAIGPVQALRRLIAIQAQYSPSPYLALAARLESFTIADLESCLRTGAIVKSSLMRSTLHLTTASQYPDIAAVVHADSVRHWQRIWGRPGVATDVLARGLAGYLASPRTADQIRAHAGALVGGALPDRGLLQAAKLLVPSIHVPPSGLWREHGAPGLVIWPAPLPSAAVASRRLVRSYLAGYGPATRADIVRFLQLRKPELDDALAAIEPLTRMTDEDGRELVDLPRAPRPRDAGLLAPPRLLPKWDSALLSHADRRRILPEALHPQVISPVNGDAAATYLLGGVVAGTWSAEREHDRVVIRLRQLRPGRDHGDPALEAEAHRTAAFMAPGATRIDVEMGTDVPLSHREMPPREPKPPAD
jgi:DNA glycosylase AlkZ-like